MAYEVQSSVFNAITALSCDGQRVRQALTNFRLGIHDSAACFFYLAVSETKLKSPLWSELSSFCDPGCVCSSFNVLVQASAKLCA